MAMKGFDKDDFSAPMAEINTTPLVDVMLVLLVIFLVTAPMLTQAIKLELPNQTATEIADEKPISISISKEGLYYWQDQPVSEEQLEQKFMDISQTDKTRPIHLRADTNAKYGKVSAVLAIAQKHNLNSIGFVTEPK